MISFKNIFYHELIGLELKVVDSLNKSLIGLSGIVVDETRNTLLIEQKFDLNEDSSLISDLNGNRLDSSLNSDLNETCLDLNENSNLNKKSSDLNKKDLNKNLSSNHKNTKLIQKDVSVFQFKVPDGTIVEIDGKILLNRPEDRIKKRYKKI